MGWARENLEGFARNTTKAVLLASPPRWDSEEWAEQMFQRETPERNDYVVAAAEVAENSCWMYFVHRLIRFPG